MRRISGVGAILVAILAFMALVAGSVMAKDYDITGKPFDFGQDFDFGGETVTFMCHYDMLQWNDASPLNSLMGTPLPELIEQAEEKFNVKIRSMVVPAQERESTLMARVLSGDSAYDIWGGIESGIFDRLVTKNVLFPVSDIVTEDYWESLTPMHRAAALAYDYKGKAYGFGSFGTGSAQVSLMSYNKTMFEAAGLPDPYDLYVDGEWTWEAMRDAAIQLTQDLDGDGIIDQYGFVSAPDYDAVGRLAYSNNAAYARVDENGKIVFAFDEPNGLEALREYKNLVDLKVFAPSGDPIVQFTSGQGAMDLTMMPWYLSQPYPDNMEDEYAVVPVPMGPAADDYDFTPRDHNALVICANAKQPLALIALVDFLFPPERITDQVFEAAFASMSPNRESFNVLKRAHAEMSPTDYQAWWFVSFNGLTDAISAFINGEKTVAAAVQEQKPRIQTALDDAYVQ
jgi:multiple sugar transport system substrate-binding protein